MDVLCELANSTSMSILEKVSKCLYLYALDATNHAIIVQTTGALLVRLTTKDGMKLNLITKRLLIRSICLMSVSKCCRSLVENNIVTCMLYLCFENDDDETKSTESTKSSTTIPSSLDMLRTIDLITILANFSYSGNSARIVRDGGKYSKRRRSNVAVIVRVILILLSSLKS